MRFVISTRRIDMQPFVDVIVVLWKSVPFMEALFEGLETLDYPRDRMTVHFVDNGPGDGSLDEVKKQMMKREGKLPPIELHEPGTNTGFSGGNNVVMRVSAQRGHAYSYLLNHDASFEPGCVREAVALAEADPAIGSVQSLLVLQQNPEEINSTGNAIQFLGFGYCAGYHLPRSSAPTEPVRIGYASGAGVLYPNRVLGEVGLLDETLFAYHEDLDLGWRILLTGRKNVLAPKSVLRHRYEFSRSIAKWFWMERNRGAVVLKNYSLLTILLLLPQLMAIDILLLAFAVSGGWWREKLRALGWFFKLSTWQYILRGRREIAKIRKVRDADILSAFTPVIAYQEFESPFVRMVANPLFRLSYTVVRAIVRW
jgi:GT2 family glycosyltransferase